MIRLCFTTDNLSTYLLLELGRRRKDRPESPAGRKIDMHPDPGRPSRPPVPRPSRNVFHHEITRE